MDRRRIYFQCISLQVNTKNCGNVETTCRNIPLSDVADTMKECACAENDCRTRDMLAFASDHTLDSVVGTVYLKFLHENRKDRSHEHHLR